MAAHHQGLIPKFQAIKICLPGGTLLMKVDEYKGVIMQGDGVEVFNGTIDI